MIMEEHTDTDIESLKHYANEVKKRFDHEKEKDAEDRFLRSSLRASSKLRAIEKYRKTVQRDTDKKRVEVNLAFEGDKSDGGKNNELTELINYIRTKMPVINDGNETLSIEDQISNDGILENNELKQWQWLLNILGDPNLSATFHMHNRVAEAYEHCKNILYSTPRYRWPILPGLAHDTMESIKENLKSVIDTLDVDKFTLNSISSLMSYFSIPTFQYLLLAMDGLANTWLVDADRDEDANRNYRTADDFQPEYKSNTLVEQSPVAGCYATLAYDEHGRDSYHDNGIRLKYVILQKGDSEFLGATVRIERNSVIVARIVTGGLAHKSNLLHENDELISANGIELMGKDLNTVCDIMASLYGKIVLLVAPALDPNSGIPIKGIIHLRALFTYEPDDDRFLACKELGLPFTKGDVVHVTRRQDQNWWQAYRSDETKGISGSIGTLAGLIPSPVYQRNRAILRFKFWISDVPPDDFELEDLSDTETQPGNTNNPAGVTNDEKPLFGNFVIKDERRILGIPIPILGRRKSSNTTSDDQDANRTTNQSGTALSGVDSGNSQSDSLILEDQSNCVMNGGLISSIYADRMSIVTRADDQNAENAIDEWSAAGPVWGQHGYDLKMLRKRRKHLANRKSKKLSPCMEQLKYWKKNKCVDDLHPSLVPVSFREQLNEDPVGWLNKEVWRGVMLHSSFWTYEPVVQYIPEPLRRRPLVFIGPAHVGRHQLMQRFIQSDESRFFPAVIHTTNKALKPNSKEVYISVSAEEFEAKRSQNEFIEWGMLNRVYYGTSRITIKQLAEQGKVCCMSLRPDSLRVMRSSGLMPYVIFISPPDRVDDLGKLRQKLNLSGMCTDEELKACIETSRRMEIRYGHWFDHVIIPETMDSAVEELTAVANRLEREPHWVPNYWIHNI